MKGEWGGIGNGGGRGRVKGKGEKEGRGRGAETTFYSFLQRRGTGGRERGGQGRKWTEGMGKGNERHEKRKCEGEGERAFTPFCEEQWTEIHGEERDGDDGRVGKGREVRREGEGEGDEGERKGKGREREGKGKGMRRGREGEDKGKRRGR